MHDPCDFPDRSRAPPFCSESLVTPKTLPDFVSSDSNEGFAIWHGRSYERAYEARSTGLQMRPTEEGLQIRLADALLVRQPDRGAP